MHSFALSLRGASETDKERYSAGGAQLPMSTKRTEGGKCGWGEGGGGRRERERERLKRGKQW